MGKQSIDRWADTRAFRFALLFAGLAIGPVLAIGLAVTVIGGGAMLLDGTAPDLEQAVFGLLAIGGALGLFGYARAHAGAARPDRHNLTATLLLLRAGVVTALAVAAIAALFWHLLVSRAQWQGPESAGVAACFVAANLVWAMSGIAWSQRLRRRYAEVAGHAFDSLPALLLSVALALATAAAVSTAAL